MSRKDDALECLLKKDYRDIDFINDDGNWFYYKVTNFWKGRHTVKVRKGTFGCEIEDA